VHHEARTSTISAWTGLSEHRVRTMVQQHARAHAEWAPTRHRGQPPRQLGYFFRTLKVATHAAVLGGLCEMLQVLAATAVGLSPRSFRSVTRGERLCQAFEIYCATVKPPVIQFEHAALLATALAHGEAISLQACPQCESRILVDHFGDPQEWCTHCRAYEPLGPVSGWTWGNGTTTTRAYDTDGKIATIASAGTKTYSYDDAFRINGIADTSAGAANWTYGYDALDRITSGTSPSAARGWTYDANGNRLTESGTAASSYSVSPTSNRIAAITGALTRAYGYDAAGNTTSYSTVTATYNNAGRLKTLTNGSATETSVYNALGQRVQITGGTTGTVLYAYDEACSASTTEAAT
jgi:YD repeat-containing protein